MAGGPGPPAKVLEGDTNSFVKHKGTVHYESLFSLPSLTPMFLLLSEVVGISVGLMLDSQGTGSMGAG